MALRATRQLRDRGENAGRLGSVMLPLATLVLVSMGYRVSLLVFAPVLSKHARGIYDWLAIFGIIGAALWLGLEVFRQSDRVTDLLRFVVGRRLATSACAKCGELIPGNAKFCGSCGAARAD
jgi:hypothetical protein